MEPKRDHDFETDAMAEQRGREVLQALLERAAADTAPELLDRLHLRTTATERRWWRRGVATAAMLAFTSALAAAWAYLAGWIGWAGPWLFAGSLVLAFALAAVDMSMVQRGG